MSHIMKQLTREARYAQESYSTPLLYHVYGEAQMARQLGALTHREFSKLTEMTVVFMNTDPEYLKAVEK